jgi:hypothetical protein
VEDPETAWLPHSLHFADLNALRIGGYFERGFRPEDVAALKAYLGSHDVNESTRAATLPIALAFQRVVQKFDKGGKSVPNELVVSYWYQSSRAYFDANRAWSAGLLNTLDAQRQRILISYLSELVSFKTVAPENVEDGIRNTLETIRSPDLEKRLTATEGVVP